MNMNEHEWTWMNMNEHEWTWMNMNEGGVIYKRGNISLIGKITFCGDAVQSSSLWFYPLVLN